MYSKAWNAETEDRHFMRALMPIACQRVREERESTSTQRQSGRKIIIGEEKYDDPAARTRDRTEKEEE